ncbi:acetoacetate decarboxylase family protein [Synechocystis sp. PCC 7509]|uniref:acetoacetate decarboxylase family protein n=1 Tax=Synechocystis sp. PCC 7509 TaxID=927677 RepID=UPI0002AD0AA7|nr:acetoacetate decarboxylase family protein [Synechocystis sp. PCC 7509]
MSYPQPPWTLKGDAFISLQLLDIARVRPFIPTKLNIISVLPGKTIGGVYLSKYNTGSVLEYSELIIIAGFLSYKGKLGGWVSHIYVDNPDSVAGGREIWGLPKELADFTWIDNSVTVSQANQVLCKLDYKRQSFGLPLKLSASAFSCKSSNLLIFPAFVESKLGLVSSKLDIPTTSPFASLNIGQPILTVHSDRLNLLVDAPTIVGQMDNR